MTGSGFSVTDREYTGPMSELSAAHFDAAVFDLDGVVTRTAKVHAAAWKIIFDDYLAKHPPRDGGYIPFDLRGDYLRYVDGKPRYEGVRSFLESRGITVPEGKPGDPSDMETICGLGNRKNELFERALRRDGVEVYASTIDFIRVLRRAGLRTAVVSSSRNCQMILEAAKVADLFEARVDGVELERFHMAGKPAPDMFIEASRRLNVEPERSVGIEDATAGVQAAKAAGFGFVIGVDRGHQKTALLEHGADIVVEDLAEVHVSTTNGTTTAFRELPSALEHLNAIVGAGRQKLALFLDYDGTLTPIVARPDEAVLSESMRARLRQLAKLCKVAIISGRDVGDVRARVGIANIWYAGSHGFDILGPLGQHHEYQEGRRYLPVLDAAEKILRERLQPVSGCLIERKRFSIATHYRQVPQEKVEVVKGEVEDARAAFPSLRLTHGKKVLELQPNIDWDKGKALQWLIQALGLGEAPLIPIYVGDDVTDEDAFRELAKAGVGILVATADRTTLASYRLNNTAEVELFLGRLGERLWESRG